MQRLIPEEQNRYNEKLKASSCIVCCLMLFDTWPSNHPILDGIWKTQNSEAQVLILNRLL
jgi:hypothetical protein